MPRAGTTTACNICNKEFNNIRRHYIICKARRRGIQLIDNALQNELITDAQHRDWTKSVIKGRLAIATILTRLDIINTITATTTITKKRQDFNAMLKHMGVTTPKTLALHIIFCATGINWEKDWVIQAVISKDKEEAFDKVIDAHKKAFNIEQLPYVCDCKGNVRNEHVHALYVFKNCNTTQQRKFRIKTQVYCLGKCNKSLLTINNHAHLMNCIKYICKETVDYQMVESKDQVGLRQTHGLHYNSTLPFLVSTNHIQWLRQYFLNNDMVFLQQTRERQCKMMIQVHAAYVSHGDNHANKLSVIRGVFSSIRAQYWSVNNRNNKKTWCNNNIDSTINYIMNTTDWVTSGIMLDEVMETIDATGGYVDDADMEDADPDMLQERLLKSTCIGPIVKQDIRVNEQSLTAAQSSAYDIALQREEARLYGTTSSAQKAYDNNTEKYVDRLRTVVAENYDPPYVCDMGLPLEDNLTCNGLMEYGDLKVMYETNKLNIQKQTQVILKLRMDKMLKDSAKSQE